MLTLETRTLLFFGSCIPARLGLAYVPQLLKTKRRQQLYGLLLFGFASSFVYMWFGNKRMDASEGGGNTWWASYRIYHGILYMIAAGLMMYKPKLASAPLAIDVLLGIALFFTVRVNVLNNI